MADIVQRGLSLLRVDHERMSWMLVTQRAMAIMEYRISLARETVAGEISMRCRMFSVFQTISCLMLSKPSISNHLKVRVRFRDHRTDLARHADRSQQEKGVSFRSIFSELLSARRRLGSLV